MRCACGVLLAIATAEAPARGDPPAGARVDAPEPATVREPNVIAPPPRRVALFPTRLADQPHEPTLGQRVQSAVTDEAGATRVAAGAVPPEWRIAERGVRELFQPSLAIVADGSAPRALAEQVLRNPAEAGPAPRTQRPAPELDRDRELDLDEQIEATQRATRQPARWRVVEIEARLDGAGGLESARVVAPSADARLDDAALGAVREAIARHPVARADGLRVARFRIAAARVVTPLDVSPLVAPAAPPRVRGLMPKVRFQFDEVRGGMKAEKPYTQEVRTDVKLVSLAR
jgi:hypothetical protein